jgi:hypothetical protein
MKSALRLTAGVALVAGLLLFSGAPSEAMPNFGQAYGVPCSTCHTAIPTLNAYGRYIQRSQYGYLDAATLKKAVPLWVGYQANYDSQASSPDTHKVVWGNLALHADGLIGDNWSYHVQQWLWNDNKGGPLDTAWVSYNNVFKHNGYLEVGKLEVPAPSPYSMWFEIAPFNTPEVTVGEHAYQLDANRWGAKTGYLRGSLSLDAAYVGSDADLNGASDFLPGNGKALQYRAAFMRPKSPVEFGVYGTSGTFPISDGLTDRYTAFAGYVQRDPLHGIPGVFFVYQTTHDSYPLAGATSAATGHDYTLNIYQPIIKDKVVIGFRREMTNDGMGTVNHYGNIDLTVQLAKYLHLYTEAGLSGSNPGNGVDRIGTPAWRVFVWWTMPIAKARP